MENFLKKVPSLLEDKRLYIKIPGKVLKYSKDRRKVHLNCSGGLMWRILGEEVVILDESTILFNAKEIGWVPDKIYNI